MMITPREMAVLLSRFVEVSAESGMATAGTNTTLTDNLKGWEANRYVDGDIHIHHEGIEYVRTITANTATVVTFNTLPAGIAPALNDSYEIRRIVIPQDVTDRSARLLGTVDSLTKWGGTTLTGRDISSDLAKLDVALSTIASKALLTPLEVASQHGVAETANIDILPSDITPTNTPCLFRIMVMLETAGVFSAILKSGAVSKTLKLNAGNSLLANCAYMFDILVHSGDTVNFQTSVSGNVTLRAQEIVGGVQ